MKSIAKLVHVGKRASIESLAHAVKVGGSADYWRVSAPGALGNLRGADGVDGRIKGLSSHALARLREAIANTEHISGSYRVYGLCFTIPWGDRLGGPGSPTQEDAAEIWRDWTNHLGRLLDWWMIGMIYRVELQLRRAVHWHMMAFLPLDMPNEFDTSSEFMRQIKHCADLSGAVTCAKTKRGRPMLDIGKDAPVQHYHAIATLRISWINTLAKWHNGAAAGRMYGRARATVRPAPPPALIKTFDYCVNCISLDSVKAGLAYLASHTTKHKQEQLGYTGKQWGYLGRKWLAVPEPMPLILPDNLDRMTRIRAYRLIRAWARRNAHKSDWRVLRPSRRVLDGGGEYYGGLTVRNIGTLYILGPTKNIIKRAFECAER